MKQLSTLILETIWRSITRGDASYKFCHKNRTLAIAGMIRSVVGDVLSDAQRFRRNGVSLTTRFESKLGVKNKTCFCKDKGNVEF